MSDHGHHDPGGHELEAINTQLLFRLVISLSVVTLLASIAVVQWFNSQRRELQERYAIEGSFQLKDYETEMAADIAGVDQVAQSIIADPSKLGAPEPPPGWVHPDDLAGGAAATPAAIDDTPEEPIPVEAPTPAEGEGDDAEGDAEGDDAAEDADADDADDDAAKDDEKPAKPEKPAEPEKPAKPAKPAKPETPADDKKADKADKADDAE